MLNTSRALTKEAELRKAFEDHESIWNSSFEINIRE